LLLDIGFIWNIYLDGEMGLVPQSVAVAELNADAEVKHEISSDVDQISLSVDQPHLLRLIVPDVSSPILYVDFSVCGNLRRLRLLCEEATLVIETSVETAEVKIYEESTV
jgi:hypothetical protein